MNLSACSPCWFAVQVKAHYEQLTAMILRNKGYEEFVPLAYRYRESTGSPRGRSRIDRPLYPGYVFCRFDQAVAAPIVTTPGVLRILGTRMRPLAVPDDDIARMRQIGTSAVNCYPWPYLRIGEDVGVVDGPLRGLHGFLLRVKNVDRLIISLDLIQRSAAVEIDASCIVPMRTYEQIRPARACTDSFSSSRRIA